MRRAAFALALLLAGCEGITYPSRLRCCEWRVTIDVAGVPIQGTITGGCAEGIRRGLSDHPDRVFVCP